jgi:hypothetical protein
VRDEDDGCGAIGERAFDVGEEGGARRGIEARGGLVEQQGVGIAGQGACEADALRLAAGEGARLAIGEVLHAQARERGGCDRAATGARCAAVAQRQLDVAADGRREEQRALGRVGEATAKRVAAPRGRHVVDAHLAAGGFVDAGEQAQQARLAGAVETEQSEPLAGGDLQSVNAEHLAPAAAMADTRDVQDRAHAAPRCCTEVSTALTANASASSTTP